MNAPSATIHLVRPDTASLLAKVADDVFDNPVSPDLLREYLASSCNALFVAMLDDQVVGMATGISYVHPDKPRSLFINEVGVSAQHRRQGIGTRLIAALLQWGQSQGCVEAWVAAIIDDEPARRFYRATGGVEDQQHAVVYSYALTPLSLPQMVRDHAAR